METADFAWLTEHSLEIQRKYAGKWIAVCNGQVVGVGDTALEAAEHAEKKHPRAECIFEWVDPVADRV